MAKVKVNKDKKGTGDKIGVTELSPWPSYIEVCILIFSNMLTHGNYFWCYIISITHCGIRPNGIFKLVITSDSYLGVPIAILSPGATCPY
jgi:hypothetical protein